MPLIHTCCYYCAGQLYCVFCAVTGDDAKLGSYRHTSSYKQCPTTAEVAFALESRTHQVKNMEECPSLEQSGKYVDQDKEEKNTTVHPMNEAQEQRQEKDCSSQQELAPARTDPVAANRCSECSKCFRKRSHLLEHMRLHFPVPWLACSACGRHFTSASKLRTHRLREEGQSRHACPHCSFRAVERHSLRRHCANVHGEVGDGVGSALSGQPEGFVCSLCGLGFSLSPDLKAHWKATHKGVVDDGGTGGGGGGTKMTVPFTCAELECGFVTRSRPEFARHVKARHDRPAAPCPHRSCRAIFSDRAAVQQHRRERHLPFHCVSCDFACSSKLQLQRHRRAGHAGPHRLACELCPFSSHNPVELESHRTRAHAGERLHRCAECGFSTPERRILNRHALTHSVDKPHKCPECEFACRDSSYLTRHMARHRDVREHMCSECGYLTKWKSALTIHMRKHSGDLRYRCDMCPYRCHRPDQLSSHKLRHGEKGLCCEVCGYACRRRAELLRHNEAKHSGCGAAGLSPSSGASVVTSTSSSSFAVTTEDTTNKPNGEGVSPKTARPTPPLHCRYCNYRTPYKQALLNHENCKHTHSRVFSCPTCPHNAFSASSLLNHRKKRHGYQPGTYTHSTIKGSQAAPSTHEAAASGSMAIGHSGGSIAVVWDAGDFREATAPVASERAVRSGVNDVERSALPTLEPEENDREHNGVDLDGGSNSGMLVGRGVLNRDAIGVGDLVSVGIGDAVTHYVGEALLQSNITVNEVVAGSHRAADASDVPHNSGLAVEQEMRDAAQNLVVPAVNDHNFGDAVTGRPVTTDLEGGQHEGMSGERLPVLDGTEQELVRAVDGETYGTLSNAGGVEETAAEVAKLLVSLYPTACQSESLYAKLEHSQQGHDSALQMLESQHMSKESIAGDCTMLLETHDVQNTQYLQPFHHQSENVVCGIFQEKRSYESIVDSRDEKMSPPLLAVTKVTEPVDQIVPSLGKEITETEISLAFKQLPQGISSGIEEAAKIPKAGQPCDPVALQKRRDRTCVGTLVEEGKVEVVVLCEARGAGRPVLRCERCPFFTRSEKALAVHARAACVARGEGGGSIRAATVAPHAIACPECGAQFKQRRALNTHQLKRKCPAVRKQCRAASKPLRNGIGVKCEGAQMREVDLPQPQLAFISGTRRGGRDVGNAQKKSKHTNKGKIWRNITAKITDAANCKSINARRSTDTQPKVNDDPIRERSSHCQKEKDCKEGEGWVCDKGRFRCLHCPFLCRQQRAILSHGRKGCLRPGQILCGICSFVCQSNGALSNHRELFHSTAKKDEMESPLSELRDRKVTKLDNGDGGKQEGSRDSMPNVEATQGKEQDGELAVNQKDHADGLKFNKDISQSNTGLVAGIETVEDGNRCRSNKHKSENKAVTCRSEDKNIIIVNAKQTGGTYTAGKENVVYSGGEEIGQRTRSKTRASSRQEIIKLERHIDMVSGVDGSSNKGNGESEGDTGESPELSNKRKNGSRNFGCEGCAFRCKQERALETHLRRGCMGPGEVQCRLCPLVCKSPVVLRNHSLSHRRAGRARSSGRAASRLTLLQCKQCPFCCKQEGALRRHVNRQHRGVLPYCCSTCEFSTKRRYRLTAHAAAVHGVPGGGPPLRPHGCDQCSRVFLEATKLRSHQRRVHDRRPTHFCIRCDYAGYGTHDVARHVEKCHSPVAAGKGSSDGFPCKSCSATFSSASALRQHLLRKHRQEPLGKDGTPPPPAAEILCASPGDPDPATHVQCTACGQEFSQHADLREHRRVQHGPHRRHGHACPTCPETFHGKQEMVLHILREHEAIDTGCTTDGMGEMCDDADEKLLRCGLCNFSCRHQVVLEHHARCHGGRKLYRCRLCTYSTRSGQKIAWHSRIHTGEKPYRCWLCEYTCTEPSRLKVHMRKHNPDTKYLCPVCGYTCKWANQLKYHMTTHTGEKPYRCEKCEYATNRSDALRTHEATRHQEGRTFVCEHCGKAFKTRYLLGSHMRKHAEVRPHVCPQCRRTFRWPAALRNHLLTHRFERPFACSLCAYQANQRAQVVSHLARRHTSEAEQGVVLDKRHVSSEMSALPLRNQSRRGPPFATRGDAPENVIGQGVGDQSKQRRGGSEETRKRSSLGPMEPPSLWVTAGGEVGDKGGLRATTVSEDVCRRTYV
ncbi:zinc finger protein 142 isoform X2 [Petromyzon marinus]|uniref:zinc finger protein 142 isoform X2 n=1 Tax=Petromyzon marinus TaxID=7757 RepID=UPI003F70082C